MSLTPTSHNIGQPVRRKEDLRLVTGKGRFSDDVNVPQQVYAVMLRSPHAHARIRSMDARKALALSGVIAVYTGADFRADDLHPIPYNVFTLHPAEVQLTNTDGTPRLTGTPQSYWSLSVFNVSGCVFLLARTSLSSVQSNLAKRYPGAKPHVFPG